MNGKVIRTLNVAKSNSPLIDKAFERNIFSALNLLWENFSDYISDDLMYVTIMHHTIHNHKFPMIMNSQSLEHLRNLNVRKYLNILIVNDYSVYERNTVYNVIKKCPKLVPFIYVDILSHCLHDNSQNNITSAAYTGVNVTDLLSLHIDSDIMSKFNSITEESIF